MDNSTSNNLSISPNSTSNSITPEPERYLIDSTPLRRRRTSSGSTSSSLDPNQNSPSPSPNRPLRSGSGSSSGGGNLPQFQQQQQLQQHPLSPTKRSSISLYSPSPSSPLSSAGTRRRQSSTSSEPTSIEESGGEEFMSEPGDNKDGSIGSSNSNSGGWTSNNNNNNSKRLSHSTLFPVYNQEFYNAPGGSGSNSSSSSILIGSSNSLPLPISISTAIPASVRLSTTPLFPSPLAQASGPNEETERARDDIGEEDSDDEAEWENEISPGNADRTNSVPFVGKFCCLFTFFDFDFLATALLLRKIRWYGYRYSATYNVISISIVAEVTELPLCAKLSS